METLTLPAAQHAEGVVALPGSKSISNRMLLLGALARGTTTLTGLLESDDTKVMQDALRALGVAIRDAGGQRYEIDGYADALAAARALICAGDARAIAELFEQASHARRSWEARRPK